MTLSVFPIACISCGSGQALSGLVLRLILLSYLGSRARIESGSYILGVSSWMKSPGKSVCCFGHLSKLTCVRRTAV